MSQDWKRFRSRLTGWQEVYMDRLNQEYSVWALEKRIRTDQKHPGAQLQPKRSELLYLLAALPNDARTINHVRNNQISAGHVQNIQYITSFTI